MTTLVKIRRQGVLTTSNHATLRLALLAQQQARIERAQAIGRRIRELREAKDWSQTQLARELDGSANKDYVSRWERGIHEPEAGYMNKLAEVFDTDVADLMGRPALATPDPVEAMTEDERLSKLEKQLQRIGRQVDAIRESVETIMTAAESRGLLGPPSEAPPGTNESREVTERPPSAKR